MGRRRARNIKNHLGRNFARAAFCALAPAPFSLMSKFMTPRAFNCHWCGPKYKSKTRSPANMAASVHASADFAKLRNAGSQQKAFLSPAVAETLFSAFCRCFCPLSGRYYSSAALVCSSGIWLWGWIEIIARALLSAPQREFPAPFRASQAQLGSSVPLKGIYYVLVWNLIPGCVEWAIYFEMCISN